jgi:hypothetical protein
MSITVMCLLFLLAELAHASVNALLRLLVDNSYTTLGCRGTAICSIIALFNADGSRDRVFNARGNRNVYDIICADSLIDG